ncbi:MAG: OmpA family protein [Paludibacteraceae bacterium]|nr:OmpA family protein [Paludibacteraceae bacterium]
MKRFIIIELLLTFTIALLADTIPTHFLGIEGHIGYDNLMRKPSYWSNKGGAGGGLGLNYKLTYKQWEFKTGLDINSFNSLSIGNYSVEEPMIEAYPTMVLHSDYKNIRYNHHSINVGVPILAGYRYKDFVFMAGLHCAFPVWQTNTLNGERITYVVDEQLYSPFYNMQNHGLTTIDYQAPTEKVGFDLQVQAEVIWNLDKYLQYHPKRRGRSRRKTFKELLHYEAAVFAQVGVLDIDPSPNQAHSLFVGAKFSIFYEFENPKKTVTPTHSPQPKPQPKPQAEPQPKPQPVADTIPSIPEVIVYQEHVVERGEAIVMENLYFATDETTVLPQSRAGLEALYQLLIDHPTTKILIVGHTDNVASEAYNIRLSQGRAEAVAQEMIKRGIDPKRITTKGRGMAQPIADNNTPEGRQKNRRVEFIIK